MKIEMPSGIGPMKTRHVEVTDQFSGRMVTAHVVICEECEDDAFHIRASERWIVGQEECGETADDR